MTKLISRFILAAAALLASCAGDQHFTLTGTVEGATDINVAITYYDGQAQRTIVTAARGGKFKVEAPLRRGAVVQIADGSGQPMGTVYAAPGDEITCKLSRANEYDITATGNAATEAWCAFVRPIAQELRRGSDAEINALVERYIAAHRSEPSATMAFACLYNASLSPHRADSVLRSIAPEALDEEMLASYLASAATFADSTAFAPVQPFTAHALHQWTTDSIVTLRPAPSGLTIYAFSGDRVVPQIDSVRPALRDFAKLSGVKLIDISLASDTFIWKRIAHRDSASWPQAWAPGGLLAQGPHRLAIPVLPYFIITDSAGTQLLRTPSVQAARLALRSQQE